MPRKDPIAYRKYMKKYMVDYRKRTEDSRVRHKEKIAELKHLASQPFTISSAVELVEKIKEL